MQRIKSVFIKSFAILSVGLWAPGLFAQTLTVTINGKLGPILPGSSGRVTSGTYESGGTFSGTGTCIFTFAAPAAGTGATGVLTLTGSAPTAGTPIKFDTADGGNGGNGYSSPPTSATLSGGTATCSGTAAVTTKLDDPLGLSGVTFTATAAVNPVGAVYNPSSVSAPVTLTLKEGGFSLPCSATATSSIGASQDTITVSGCSVSLLGESGTFSTTIALPAGSLVSPIPLAFSASLLNEPSSTATYTAASDTTVLGITGSGPVTAVCSSCPSLTGVPTGGLTFTAQQGGSAPSQTFTVGSSPTENEAFALVTNMSSGTGWLSANVGGAAGGQIGSTVTVAVSPGSLATGTYHGSVSVYSAASNSPTSVPVTLTVTLPLPSMTFSGAAPSFTYTPGSTPANQSVTIGSTGTAINYTAASSSAGNWLQVSPTSGATGTSETVSINTTAAAALATGNYQGTLIFSCTAGTCGNTNGQLTVSVNLTVDAALTATPSLTFTYTIGGSAPAAQPVAVGSTGGAIPYTDVAASAISWLAAAPAGATTPTGLTASVNPAVLTGIQPGTYPGTITLSSPFATNNGLQVSASLVVNPEPTLTITGSTLSSNTLTFNMTDLGSLPAAQTLNVAASNSSAIPYTVAVTLGNAWLSATPSGSNTPGTVSVAILANSLTPGTYNGALQISSTQASNSPQTINVTLVVGQAPSLSATPNPLAFVYQLNGTAPPTQTLNVTNSGPPLTFTAVANGVSGGFTWLSVSSPTGATPQALTVTATPGSLAAGTYNGTITLTCAQAGNSPVTVNVSLTINALPSLTASPSSLTFAYTIGGTVPGGQNVTIGTNGNTPLTGVTVGTPNVPWFTATPSGSTTPVTLAVSLVTAQLPTTPGPYTGSVVINATGAAAPLTYTVTLNVAPQPALSVAPSALNFSATTGGPSPSAQALTVSAANGTIAFTAVAAVTSPSGGNWLSVTPISGSTNSSTTLQVTAATGSLAAGSYAGTITVQATTSGVLNPKYVIPVTFAVAANQLTSNQSQLNFTYTIGGSVPALQTISVGSTVPGLSFTAAANPAASWLSIVPGGGTTPQTLNVSIVTAGLTPGTYNTNIALSSAGAGNSPLNVPVKLTVNAMPVLSVVPATITFNYLTGSTIPTGQSVALSTSNNSSTPFTLSTTYNSGSNWLVVPAGGTAPSSFVVNISPTGLTTGTYTATVNVTATGYTATSVAVTIVVTQPKATIQVTGTTGFSLANTAAPVSSLLAISSSDGSAQAFTISAAPGQTWLTLSAASGTTPANVNLVVNPSGLVPGSYQDTVTVTMPALPIPTKTIQVTLTITGSNLVASPNTLSFSYQTGAALPPAQNVALTPASGTGTVPISSITSNVTWIVVSQALSAPATLKVSINPGLLVPGTYLGSVFITGTGSPTPSLEISVSLTVSAAATLTVTPAALAFTYQPGGTAPAPQSFAISTGGTPLTFTATSPGSWLQLSPTTGTTPGSVLVTVNPAGLGTGTFTGTIGVKAAGASNSGSVAVTLTITGPPEVTVTPSMLSFTSTSGTAPAPQTLSVTNQSGAIGFTAAGSAAWISVTPTSGTTPATLSVSVNPSGLQSGIYSGSVIITTAGSTTPQMIPVTLQSGTLTTPTITSVIDAASGASGTIAPGMAISIFGTALGPQTGVEFAAPAAGGALATTLSGTQVMFGTTPAPVLYTSATQINVLVPFEVSTETSTSMTVIYNGVQSAAAILTITPAQPGIFTANEKGTGQGAILNQDGTINSSTLPAAAGSVIQIFGTGGGLTNPASIDGTLNPIPGPTVPLGALVATPVTATVNGATATVDYSGPAPGLLAGIIQINVTIPSGTPSGNIPLTVTVGDNVSQTVTVAVQ